MKRSGLPEEYSPRLDTVRFRERVEAAFDVLRSCELCPRNCRTDRLAGESGFCKLGKEPVVSSYGPHFGEEPPLVGRYGSGTIFLTGCNLGCIFCQNYDISHLRRGSEVTIEEMSEMMLELQERGCHNINFVTPTHQVPQILRALLHARERGMVLPVVYNCGGYESIKILKLLDGIVDIYMPDAKYMDAATAKRLSGVSDYPEVLKRVLVEMHKQVGDLHVSIDGIATRGLLLRHLVLPQGLAQTADLVEFVATNISKDTYVNIMGQYRPCYKAYKFPPLDRSVNYDEVEEAKEMARSAGLHRGFTGDYI